MRCLSAFCLGLVTALLGFSPALAEDAPDTVTLASGERVPCTVLSAGARVVRVRIGTKTYDFERASLAKVERGGVEQLDAEILAFVADVAKRVNHPNARLARAAKAALTALAEEGRPYLEAAAENTKDGERREALRALARGTDGAPNNATRAAAFIEARVKAAREMFSLDDAQTGKFSKAVEAMFADLRAGTAFPDAWAKMKKAAESFLAAEQMKKIDAWAKATFRRRGGQ